MGSYHLPIQFMTLNATDKEKMGKVLVNLRCLIFTWYRNVHKLLPKSNQLKILIVLRYISGDK